MSVNITIFDVEQTDPVRIKAERDMLIKAIFEMLVTGGVLNPTVVVSAPQLLMLMDEVAEHLKRGPVKMDRLVAAIDDITCGDPWRSFLSEEQLQKALTTATSDKTS